MAIDDTNDNDEDAIDDGTIPADHNHAILLNGTDDIWLIREGMVDVFSVSLVNGEVVGTRRHLFRAEVPDVIFGLGADSLNQDIGLLAVGTTGTRLLPITDEKWKLYWAEQWVLGVLEGVAKGAVMPTHYQNLSEPQSYFINQDEHACSHGGLYWISDLKGRADWMGLAAIELPENICLPITPRAWLTAKDDVTFECRGFSEELEPECLLASLHFFHQHLVTILRHLKQAEHQREAERLKQKAQVEERALATSLHRLADILGRHADALLREKSGIPLLDACQMVLNATGIKTHLTVKKGTTADELSLEEITRGANLANRQVALTGRNWWREDHGPLLAFTQTDNRPVALLPHGASGYQLLDVETNQISALDEKLAKTLGTTAVMFFRPLPRKEMNAFDLLKFCLTGAKADLWRVAAMGVLGGLLGIFVPFATGLLFDSILPSAEMDQLMQISLLLLVTAFATAGFELIRAIAMLRIQGRVGQYGQAAIIDRMLNLPNTFFGRYSSGDLTQRAFGIDSMSQLMSSEIQAALLQGVFSLFLFVYLFLIDLRLALIATALTAVLIIVTVVVNRLRLRYQRKQAALQGEIAGRVLQILTGIAKLRVAGAELLGFNYWAKLFAQQKQESFKAQRLSVYLVVFNNAFTVLASLVIFAAMVLLNLKLNTGTFLAFNAAFAQFLVALQGMSMAATVCLSIVPFYERAMPILQTVPEAEEEKTQPGELTGNIELSHVSFRYHADGPLILNDISLKIKAGEFVAFVGSSGSGKSTLFRMLLGFETAESGAVYYDGQDIASLDIRSVRRQFGVVLQSGKLMPGDIFTNIIGSAPLTLDDAWVAARAVGLDKDIEAMPMGMHTVISEGASTLSGGQRQRLMIARALVKRPRILLFDEATSALDNRTQAIVSESVEKLNATRIVIAHRLSTIVKADRIYVIDKGNLVESGNYEELMDKQGLFAELAKRQIA